MGLWNIWDPKLKELGLVEDQDEVAKRDVRQRRARAADAAAPDSRRATRSRKTTSATAQLIANYIKDKTGAIEQFDRDGKTYVRVNDYQKMREGVGSCSPS